MKYLKWIIGIIIILIAVFLFLFLFHKKEEEHSIPLFELEEYNHIQLDDIKQIDIVSYTEGGAESVLEDDFDSFQRTFNRLSQVRVGNETNMACEDNTTVYIIQLKDDTEVSIEIECDWLVIDGKRYEIVQ